jgi:hypothetical protein
MSAAEAWSEYLAWTRGSAPAQYDETEALAWGRLQIALSPDPRPIGAVLESDEQFMERLRREQAQDAPDEPEDPDDGRPEYA